MVNAQKSAKDHQMVCLLCKSRGENTKTFNINFLCGDAKYTIKDDLTEFLGEKVEPLLKVEDVVCNICMVMLDDIAKIKRKVMDIILLPDAPRFSPIRLGTSWDFFARCYKYGVNDFHVIFDEPMSTGSLTPVTPTQNRLTPNQFWSISHSKRYNPELEEKCAKREMAKRQRSQSKLSIRSVASSKNDEEVATLFKGRKRKGRRAKSAGGLPKVLTKKLRRVQSEIDRTTSSLSNLSCVSCTKPKKDFRAKTPKLKYGENNELLRPRTRSITRLVFYCPHCSEDLKGLDIYTSHMVGVHDRKAWFKCLDCDVNYLTQEHLTMHQKIHINPTICTICGEKYNNMVDLKKHADGHFQYSVPCAYCDFAFLSEYECNLHAFNHHRSRRRKVNRKQHKIKEIASYVDVDSNKTADTKPFDSNYSTKEFTSLSMPLTIETAPTFHHPSFDDLDYSVRHPCPALVSKSAITTSLVGDFKRNDRFLSSRCSYSPGTVVSNIDVDAADSPFSESSPSELVSRRKGTSSRRRRSMDINKQTDLSPIDRFDTPHEDVAISNSPEVLDRLSPFEERILDFENTIGEESDDSSGSIQTEMHYLVDGKTLFTNVDLADIVNITGSTGSGESNPPAESVELDPDIVDI